MNPMARTGHLPQEAVQGQLGDQRRDEPELDGSVRLIVGAASGLLDSDGLLVGPSRFPDMGYPRPVQPAPEAATPRRHGPRMPRDGVRLGPAVDDGQSNTEKQGRMNSNDACPASPGHDG